MIDNRYRNKSGDPLLQPLKIRHLTLKNRVMSTSHASGLHDSNMPAARYQEYHAEKANGGLALTMFGGSSNVAPDSPNVFGQLRVDSDTVIPYFQTFSEKIHAHKTALMCQITHLGRRGDATVDYWLPTIAPSTLRETLHRSIPREMDKHDIHRVVTSFGQAARRCYEGGLDGLETHAGAHLIGQFFSPETNRRTDKYGGSVENRVRFALMVHEEIRKNVGNNFLVGMRMSMEENRGGLSHVDALEIAEILQREGAIDFLNCVFGRMDTELALAEKNMPGMTQPIAPFLERMRLIKQSVSVPVFHAARIVDIASARYAIQEGLLDMVAMTRAHIADPHIVNKILRGEEDRIRPCFGASHCMHKRPSCIHNVATGRELDLPQLIPRSNKPGKKVVVVGGGPAGLEAARVAAERGHSVTLLEASSRLGGQLLMASKAGWRRDIITVVDWRISELAHLAVEVVYDCYATSEDVLDYQPDVVVVACGGVPTYANLLGQEYCNNPWDILSGEIQPAEHVLVYDGTGRHEALSCAQHMSDKGSKVVVAAIDDRPGAELGYAERATHKKELYKRHIPFMPDLALDEVVPSGNRLTAFLRNDLTDDVEELAVDQIVVEHGTTPNDELFHELSELAANKGVVDIAALLNVESQPRGNGEGYDLYRVGDAISSRSLHAVLLDAYRLALAL